jgi:hypothetical protein
MLEVAAVTVITARKLTPALLVIAVPAAAVPVAVAVAVLTGESNSSGYKELCK